MMEWLRKLFGNSKESSESQSDVELADWRIFSLQNEPLNQSGILRLRIRRPDIPDIDSFRTAIEISWPYNGDMPSDDTNHGQAVFEKAVDELTGENGFSELVQVSTGFGKKEWLFYTSDQSRYMDELNNALSQHERFPIEIAFYEDPDWKIWSDMLGDLKNAGAVTNQ
jgi:hypothetical protein